MTYSRSQGHNSNSGLVIRQSLYMRQLELGPEDTVAWPHSLGSAPFSLVTLEEYILKQ